MKVPLIPIVDTVRPEDKHLHSGNAVEWEKYWDSHSTLEVTPLSRGKHKISSHYCVWMNVADTMSHAKARRTE